MIYPPECAICGQILRIKGFGVCSSCKAKISYVTEPLCLKCGKEIHDEDVELCDDCNKHIRTYVRGYPAMNYVAPVTKSVGALKYDNKRGYAKIFAQEIARRYGRDILEIAPDAFVPVPIHSKKLKTRGYNQAELLADNLGRIFDIPVDANIIRRDINTSPQKNLDDEQRENNLKRAFNSTGKIVKYNKVMLVDDIYTTGSTIEACTRVLHSIGIREVFYTSICIGKGK